MSATATRTAATSVSRKEMDELLTMVWALMDKLMELTPAHPELVTANQLCGVLVGLLKERQEAGEAKS
jgi:hypothetical protein